MVSSIVTRPKVSKVSKSGTQRGFFSGAAGHDGLQRLRIRIIFSVKKFAKTLAGSADISKEGKTGDFVQLNNEFMDVHSSRGEFE